MEPIKKTTQYLTIRERTADDITALALLAIKIANTFPEKKIKINESKSQNINLFTLFLGESTKTKKSSIAKLVKPMYTIPLGSGEAMSDLPNGAVGAIMIDEIQRSLLPKIKNENATLQSWLCRVWDDGTNFQFAVRKRSANGDVKELTNEVKKVNLSLCGQGIADLFFKNLPDVMYSSGLLWRFLFIPIEGKIKHYSDYDYFIEGKGAKEVSFEEEPNFIYDSFTEFDSGKSSKNEITIDDKIKNQKFFNEILNVGETAHAIRSKDMIFRLAGAFAVLKNNVADEECFSYAKDIVQNSIAYLSDSFREENADERFILEFIRANKMPVWHHTLYLAFTRENKTKEQWSIAINSLLGFDKYGRIDNSIEPLIEKNRKKSKTFYSLSGTWIFDEKGNATEVKENLVYGKNKKGKNEALFVPKTIEKEKAVKALGDSENEDAWIKKLGEELF